MKLALMQPYFFPYLGYFDLIYQVDRWIVFDTVQYTPCSWMTRNRVLHPSSGWQYIRVPVERRPRGTAIRDIVTFEQTDWRGRLRGQLQHYKRHAPYYAGTMNLIDQALESRERSMSRLNVAVLELVCRYLQVEFHHCFLSELDLDLGPISRPSEWALRICRALGADTYVNAPGGIALYNEAEFAAEGMRLSIRPALDLQYDCPGYVFQPALSIIDVLMWNAPDRIRHCLANCPESGRVFREGAGDVAA